MYKKRTKRYFVLFSVIFLSVFLTIRLWPHETLSEGIICDKVIVSKAEKKLTLFKDDKVIKEYNIALGRTNGQKIAFKDNRTPEGNYYIVRKLQSDKYHMAIRISYPHDADIKAFLSRRERPGGNIAIHGIRSPFGWLGTWHSLVNWTRGCIAVTNEEIEELARVIPEGTPIEIRP